MPEELQVDAFLARAGELPVIDVRTPSEFALGHIPGAVNVPLFSDDERAEVGTTYKKTGRREAVMVGLRLVGPRLDRFSEQLLEHAGAHGNRALVNCWRGGMRSASVAWLLENFECRVATLKGGYKAFRGWVLESFELPRKVSVVAGLTGSGKTAVLGELARLGQQVIDLEGLAHHKGSAFGALGEKEQPPQQQFENRLALEWRASDPERPLWLEDESRSIGRLGLPEAIWDQKKVGRFHFLELPDEERVRHLCEGYAAHPPEVLAGRVEAISRRLGSERVSRAIGAIENGDHATACRIVLAYYDKAYRHCLEKAAPDPLEFHRFETLDPAAIAATLAEAER
jgi:tRNA 2-selenouridine synthase